MRWRNSAALNRQIEFWCLLAQNDTKFPMRMIHLPVRVKLIWNLVTHMPSIKSKSLPAKTFLAIKVLRLLLYEVFLNQTTVKINMKWMKNLLFYLSHHLIILLTRMEAWHAGFAKKQYRPELIGIDISIRYLRYNKKRLKCTFVKNNGFLPKVQYIIQ